MKHEYILKKRGLYYRPKAQGYTPSVLEAGLYSKADAIKLCEKSGVCMIRLIDMLPEIDAEREQITARLEELDRLEHRALGLRD